MKRIISFLLCLFILLSFSFNVSAESTSKIDKPLLELIEISTSTDKLEIFISLTDSGLTERDMPSWPDFHSAKIELAEYEEKRSREIFDDIFIDIEYELLYFIGWSGSFAVEVKAEDIPKIADNTNVLYIGKYIWKTPVEEEPLLKSKFLNQFDVTEIEEYSELYFKYGENEQLQWVLIQAVDNDHFSLEYVEVLVGDVLVSTYVSAPFYLSYGIYDAKEERFIDLYDIKDDYSDYEGLLEVLLELPGNRQIGDVNNDSKINILDATLIQRCIAKVERYHYNTVLSDFDRDGTVDICDVTAIQRLLANI